MVIQRHCGQKIIRCYLYLAPYTVIKAGGAKVAATDLAGFH